MINNKAYTEVYFIINEMSDELKSKIPEDILNVIKNNMDKNYDFCVDIDNIDYLTLLDDTQKILSVLYTDYLASEEEKEIILNKERSISSKQEVPIKINEIFSNSNKEKSNMMIITNETESNHKLFKRILQFLKNMFK